MTRVMHRYLLLLMEMGWCVKKYGNSYIVLCQIKFHRKKICMNGIILYGLAVIGIHSNRCRIGFQRTFNIAGVIETARTKISGEISMYYGFVPVEGIDVFAVEVAQSEKKIFLEEKCYVYENNDVQEMTVNQKNGPTTLFISYTECDTPIKDIIENKIKERLKNKVKISRYTELRYKDSFKQEVKLLMQSTTHLHVLCSIVSPLN